MNDVTIGVKTLGSFGAALLVSGIWLGTLQTTVWAEQGRADRAELVAAKAAEEQVQQGKDISSIKATLDARTAAILRALERLEAKDE